MGEIMDWIQFIAVMSLFIAANFVWYWQGFKDGKREGYTRGRNVSRSAFWQE
jgi:hypothetical protein